MTWIVFILGVAFLGVPLLWKPKKRRSESLDINEAELAAAERALKESDQMDWVVLERLHGPGYNISVVSDILGTLSNEGIECTYDLISTSSADAGVTNYMLKVARGQEQRAREIMAKLRSKSEMK